MRCATRHWWGSSPCVRSSCGRGPCRLRHRRARPPETPLVATVTVHKCLALAVSEACLRDPLMACGPPYSSYVFLSRREWSGSLRGVEALFGSQEHQHQGGGLVFGVPGEKEMGIERAWCGLKACSSTKKIRGLGLRAQAQRITQIIKMAGTTIYFLDS